MRLAVAAHNAGKRLKCRTDDFMLQTNPYTSEKTQEPLDGA